MNKNVTTGQICYHPNLRPTRWNQPAPEPCNMNTCKCGKNQICPVCGYGFGTIPCDCNSHVKIDYSQLYQNKRKKLL